MNRFNRKPEQEKKRRATAFLARELNLGRSGDECRHVDGFGEIA